MKKKYLVLGLGKSGKAACNFLLNRNKQVIAIDNNLIEDDEIRKIKQNNVEVLKDNSIDFKNIEKVIISPGINPNHEIIIKAKKNNVEVIGEIELGCQYLKNRCIAITGTNGKTTLTKLITHIFNENGLKAVALGNVGLSLTSYMDKLKEDEIVVLELSSFQLETMHTKFIDSAVIINITPDHLDRYKTLKEYAIAKLNIVNCLKKDKILYTNKKVIKRYFVLNDKINIKEVDDEVDDIAKEICLDWKISEENIDNAIKTFKRIEHRLEFVREINGISFYNDSKATNVDSVIYAVKKIKMPIVLIAGGVDKGFPYKIWEKPFKDKIKYIIAIGQSANKIKMELPGFNVEIMNDFESAIKKAFSLAQKNEAVLLSPGCSSFDMFKNYEHRGEVFKKIVNNILGEKCHEEIL
jgi:UDP-N-acetylmuramoylalanine--D-glutamate ligase